MKRHLVMDLFHGYQNEVVEGDWNKISEKDPEFKSESGKVRVKLHNGNETFAYYYKDKCMHAAKSYKPTHFWNSNTHEPIYDVSEWIYLKD